MTDKTPSKRSRLAQSAYNSPYARAGAPDPHPNTDPYVGLRKKALTTLQAMGFDPKTMVERGVFWAEDQDPFGHVQQAKYMEILGLTFFRVMESYDEHPSEQEYNDMITARTVIPAVRKYELSILKQVHYPDSLVGAYRQERIEGKSNSGTTVLFSLQQQAIVAEVKGFVVYTDVKTGRPIDIRTVGDGWKRLFDAFTDNSEKSRVRREQWEVEHQPKKCRISKM